MSSQISVNNLKYKIRENNADKYILNGINFEFKKSDLITISGPSGSGKTTFVYALAGLLDDIEGEIKVGTASLHTMNRKEKDNFRLNNIGLVFQNLNLFEFMNVEDNIAMPLLAKNKPITEEIKVKIGMYLELMQLGKIQNKLVSSLSGGEKQRVAIIRALIDNPKYVICDEPTANLDSKSTLQFMDLLVKLKNHTDNTIIISTHDDRVVRFSDKNIELVDGRIVSQT